MVQGYDLKSKKMVEIKNPKTVTKKTKKGRTITMIMGISPLTGVKVSRIISNK
jgi:hypothetical protein